MQAKEVKQIVEGLRCSSTPGKMDISKCLQCPYHTKNKCDGMFVPEISIGCEGYYLTCETDKICQDAADMIEKLASEGTIKVGWATLQKMIDDRDREISELKIEVLQLKRKLGTITESSCPMSEYTEHCNRECEKCWKAYIDEVSED